MGRIIDNYAAYEVSADIIARDLAAQMRQREEERQRQREQAQWMAEQMEIIRAEMEGRPIPMPKPKPKPKPEPKPEPEKTCSRCGRKLPFSRYHKNRHSPNGLCVMCKDCVNETRARYKRRKNEGLVERDRQRREAARLLMEKKAKVCRRCGRELPAAEFGLRSQSRDGLQACCRQCVHDKWSSRYYEGREDKRAKAEAARQKRARAKAEAKKGCALGIQHRMPDIETETEWPL